MDGQTMRNFLFLLIFLIVMTSFWRLLGENAPENPLSLHVLVEELNAGSITQIEVDGNNLLVETRNGSQKVARKGG